MTSPFLVVRNLTATVENKPILRGVGLTLAAGELHVLMGPNGSGKTTLALALAGSPLVTVTGGTVTLAGVDLLPLTPDARARAGMLLAFQYPIGIPGLSLAQFLSAARQARCPAPAAGAKHSATPQASDPADARLVSLLERLKLPPELARREVNEGLSGGEKKKSEMVQLAMLQPKLALLDEPDSGLDIDALKLMAGAIADFHRQGTAILLITHYHRILQFLSPDAVHVMVAGRIIQSGGAALAVEVERMGYEPLVAN